MALAGPWANLARCQHEAGSDLLRGGWVIAAGEGQAAAAAAQRLPTPGRRMGASWGSRLCSDPLETPTNPCPSAPACPHPHPLGRGAAGDVPALGMALGTRGGQMRWHREWGQGRAWRHPGGEALCQQGSVCPMAGPLAVLSNEPRGTMAVMMEPSLLPCSQT